LAGGVNLSRLNNVTPFRASRGTKIACSGLDCLTKFINQDSRTEIVVTSRLKKLGGVFIYTRLYQVKNHVRLLPQLKVFLILKRESKISYDIELPIQKL
jgi:hypothetical protein